MNGTRILRIDLTRCVSSFEIGDPKVDRDYIGGRGLGTRYLLNEIDPGLDPLSPANKLIFATGPATGSRALSGSRGEVVTKSPLTGTVTCANWGGFFPTELKRTGHDMVIFEGRAEEPVYVWIKNEKVEIRPAQNMWGKNTLETRETLLRETSRDVRVACIGPAGERLVRIANIINDAGHAAGRGGIGAVMGSKNLKAVAVEGTREIPVADEKGLKELAAESWRKLPKPQSISKWGSTYLIPLVNAAGALPTRNWQTGVFEGIEKISPELFHRTIFVKPSSCYRCPFGCCRLTEVTHPPFTTKGEGPHYEGLYSFGCCCGVDNLEAIARAYHTCNDLGVDIISCGVTLACAMEMFEKRILSDKDIGTNLNFGNGQAMVELVRKIGYREGFGEFAGEGSYRLAERYDHPEYSMSTKRQELGGYDPRGCQGMGLGYATSNRGGDHLKGATDLREIFGLPEKVDPFITEGKAALAKEMQDETAAIDSMGICFYGSGYKIGIQVVVTELELATGNKYGVEGFMKSGERIWNLERLFNLQAGFTAKDDTLPKRLLEEPMPEGPAKGYVCKLDEMLTEYYRLRGWDAKGKPIPNKMKELDLERNVE